MLIALGAVLGAPSLCEGASSHWSGSWGGEGVGGSLPHSCPAFTSSKQSQFCFMETIPFPRSLLNDAFKGLFFVFFPFKTLFFFLFALEGKKGEEKANKAITKC